MFFCFAFIFSLTGCGLNKVTTSEKTLENNTEDTDITVNNNEKTVQLDTKETLSDLTYMVNSGWDKSEVDDGYYYYPDTTCMLYFYANEAPVEIADDAFFQLFIINFLEKNQDAEYLNVSCVRGSWRSK